MLSSSHLIDLLFSFIIIIIIFLIIGLDYSLILLLSSYLFLKIYLREKKVFYSCITEELSSKRFYFKREKVNTACL